MKYSIIFLLGASAMRLNKKFAIGAEGDENLSQDIAGINKAHEEAVYGQIDSDVQWVELPDCSKPKGEKEIALNEDLSNVSTATCKIRKPLLDPEANYCPDKKKKKAAANATANTTNGTNGTNGTNATNATNGSNATNATTVEPPCVSKPI